MATKAFAVKSTLMNVGLSECRGKSFPWQINAFSYKDKATTEQWVRLVSLLFASIHQIFVSILSCKLAIRLMKKKIKHRSQHRKNMFA